MQLKFSIVFACLLMATISYAQPAERWQQSIDYKMNIDFDVQTHRFDGTQKIVYKNNSPDTLNRVFYHLYFNAFQPGSMMDVRSGTLMDADPRVGSRIAALGPNEIGYLRVSKLTQNGKATQFAEVGTILEVELAAPLLPNQSTTLDMEFKGQVPVQIRRSGRNSAEGISYSMSQWYPKLCEYDYQGWHANPYIGREFHGVWGDFDVSITINKDYVIGGSGYLQDADKIGYGYEKEGVKVPRKKGKTTTWRFLAPNVHDFVWAADPDYKHTSLKSKSGAMLHFLYQENEKTRENWAKLPAIMDEALEFINRTYGQYPYDQYSFIQGGDGGMEYPMATLITGERQLSSLVGVSVHELMHSWYQMVLGTNEALYAWMDEGFTSYASAEVMNYLRGKGLLPGTKLDNPNSTSVRGFSSFARSGREEPLSTHADHFMSNAAYGVGSYTKGALFLNQLNYIIGKQAFDRTMLRYYDTWKFKHPNPNDFIRIAEKESGLELDWYREYWVNTTQTIDYAIAGVDEMEGKAVVKLERLGFMPMPMDILVEYTDGSSEMINIPLRIMRGAKPQEDKSMKYTVAEDWPWTHPEYELPLSVSKSKVKSVSIESKGRLVDVDADNDKL